MPTLTRVTPAVTPGSSGWGIAATARLMVYSSDYSNIVRPFDRLDVTPEAELWTPVVGGEEIVVEVYVTTAQRPQLQLHLSQIGSGYRFFGAGPTANVGLDGGSGPCQVDVVCPGSSAWINEIPCVAAISSGGSIFCTGFMVNNTAQDGRNFFITANHCGVTSGASLVCYWNYQRPVCGAGTGPLTMFNTGAAFRASYLQSDVTLVELNATPNPAWGVTYAGWDRSGTNATSSCGIHHPSGDDKKISFENQATITTSYLGTSQPGNGSHVCVIDWDSGTTEPGSSGSPLFDQNHRVIGQLHGGYSACGVNLADWYGGFALSWTGGGSNSTRLSNWLDPLGTGAMTVDFRGANGAVATKFGFGCYADYASFHERFPGAVDLAGTAASTVSIQMTPTAGGYQVQYGPNSWYAPTGGNLNLGDDALSSTRSLPFTFNFPGGATSGVRLCSNGFVWLDGTSTDFDDTPSALELSEGPARLAPLWCNLDPSAGGTIHFDTDPNNQAVYCTWLGVPAAGSTGTAGNTFQLVLRSSGVVELRYRLLASTPTGALVGWSPGNGALVTPSTDLSAAMPFQVGPDVPGLTFTALSRPVQGSTVTLELTEIPFGTIFGGVFLGFGSYPAGIHLASFGMPGCYQYCSQEYLGVILAVNPTYPFQVGVPTGAYWSGLHLFAQAATLTAGVNTIGALSSNGIDLLFNPY